MTDELVEGTTHVKVDNVSPADMRPASIDEEPTIFMTRLEVEAMLRKDKERYMGLKPPYIAGVATKPHPVG